mmetsp:Transcript_31062/g.77287  ORF Transcript_31062/g.77287 Transcript_31062/m.77287 type:complete len:311 (+) Transcript_31062:3613-4545(+)
MLGSKLAGVLSVMSLGMPSRVHPTASFAAILAMGKPVALDARAEERLTRGFISMIISSPSAGLMAICTLDPPHSTPISRMMATEASRRRWYSLSVRVCAGAMVMESPVCTPMGSRFSMEHTITTLSARSRITSSSYSFHPSRDFSISTWLVADASTPLVTIVFSSSRLYAMPPPEPPRVKAGRMMSGKEPISSAIFTASSQLFAVPEGGVFRPIFCMASLKSCRSSALLMASSLAPMSSTPYFSSTPLSASVLVRLSAVCPPMVGRSAQGLSLARMSSTNSGVMGPTYVRFAVSGSVMMVAGLELRSTTS